MSIKYIDDNILDIYIMKDKINIDLNNSKELEKYIRKILQDKDINGFYYVIVYIDKYYGIVIHLEKDKLDYFNYYKDELDMKISVKNSVFLYQIDNFNYKGKIHIINNNMYLEIESDEDLMYIMENCNNILYNYSK